MRGCVSMVMRVCVWVCQYGDEGGCVGVSVW